VENQCKGLEACGHVGEKETTRHQSKKRRGRGARGIAQAGTPKEEKREGKDGSWSWGGEEPLSSQVRAKYPGKDTGGGKNRK